MTVSMIMSIYKRARRWWRSRVRRFGQALAVRSSAGANRQATSDEIAAARVDSYRAQRQTGAPLFTWHGTVVFVDVDTGELRHGLVEDSPPNVVLIEDSQVVRLSFLGAAGQRDIACIPEQSAVVDSEKTSDAEAHACREFSLVPKGATAFGLTARGQFLSAERDGRISFNRTDCLKLETFHSRINPSEITGTVVSQRIDGEIIHFFITNRKDWLQCFLCRGDFFERDMLDLIRLYLDETKVFVDVGANIGNHAIFVSKYCKSSNIIIFEPNPDAIKILNINLALNRCLGVDATHVGLALGGERRKVRPIEPVSDNMGRVQMVADTAGIVDCIVGDDILLSSPVGVVKIDVEGMEFEVLKGLRATISRWRPTIFIEVWKENRESLLDWCAGADYEISKKLSFDNYMLRPRAQV